MGDGYLPAPTGTRLIISFVIITIFFFFSFLLLFLRWD